MKSARLWPMVTALVLLLSGTGALEVVARNAEGRVLSWDISGNEVAVDGEDQDTNDEADEAWQGAEAVNEAHADARPLARRGDYEQALARFTGAVPLDPPRSFVGSLRPYQREGARLVDVPSGAGIRRLSRRRHGARQDHHGAGAARGLAH